MNKHHPYHPIIYVRGFAATHDEIEETVADPYMGFNAGSTKARQVSDGKLRKFVFESPIVRLKDEIVWIRDPSGSKLRRRVHYEAPSPVCFRAGAGSKFSIPGNFERGGGPTFVAAG